MKHRKSSRQFGRVRSQRTALKKSLLEALILHEQIKTTEAKAKELKSEFDKIVTRAKRAHEREKSMLAVVKTVEGCLTPTALKRFAQKDFFEKFSGRSSGYTRVVKLPPRRVDAAKMAVIKFV
jgi:large subunit ribosomal protein L17